MSDPTAAPWDPEFADVAVVVLALGGLIAFAGVADGDVTGVLAWFAGAAVCGLMMVAEKSVSSPEGGDDE